MKKNHFSLCIWAVLCLLPMLQLSCVSDAKLKIEIAVANKKCPIDMGAIGQISKITYDGKDVAYFFEVNEPLINVEALKSNQDLLMQSVRSQFVNPKGDIKTLLNLVVDAGANLKFVYKGNTTGNTAECFLSASEIKSIMSGENLNDGEVSKLESIIKISNAQLPQNIGDGLVLEKMTMEGPDVFYNYMLDTTLVDISVINAEISIMKATILESLKQETSVFMFLNSCVDEKKNLVYRYRTPAGETADVRVSVDELDDLVSTMKENIGR
ncbi:MAG: hypothetical protein WCU80_05100 [Paludibacteraceae bacterium]